MKFIYLNTHHQSSSVAALIDLLYQYLHYIVLLVTIKSDPYYHQIPSYDECVQESSIEDKENLKMKFYQGPVRTFIGFCSNKVR